MSLSIDFLSGKQGYRLEHISRKNELIAKAVGIKANYIPRVIDATAGLGRDAVILTCLGCDVLALERNQEVYQALQTALQQACLVKPELFKHLHIKQMNALDYLTQLSPESYPDVIYLDPMFPERKKSALVKKELRQLKELVGDDLDAEQLFVMATQRALKRVVVKRPLHAPLLSDYLPDIQYKGKAIRYDVYL